MYHTIYYEGEQIKPCIETCDLVSERCPFFRPYGETLIGEPGFLCKGGLSFTVLFNDIVYGNKTKTKIKMNNRNIMVRRTEI